MNKFNPNKVPSWCNWIAIDKDGDCVAFKTKPVAISSMWVFDGFINKAEVLYEGKPPKNWKDELYTWG